MADGKVTQAFAATFVDELARAGLREVCLAPGSRSAPLAMAFARHPQIRCLVHIDERSCAFFALCLAKAGGRPVAVLCTSGTAAAEFHPAVIEAAHSRTPLLVLTADRPPELREVGANQAVDQARLYGGAVRWYFDPGPPEDSEMAGHRWRRLAGRALAEALGPPSGPVHLNLPLREPLTPPAGTQAEPLAASADPVAVWVSDAPPSAATVDRFVEALQAARRPLLVAGEMRDGARLRGAVHDLASRWPIAVLAEPSSQLRIRGLEGLVEGYDAILRDPAWSESLRPDLVLRLGAPPTSKPVNSMLAAARPQVIAIDADGWRDPDLLVGDFIRCDEVSLLEALAARLGNTPNGSLDRGWQSRWVVAGAGAAAAIATTLAAGDLHEGHVVRSLADLLPAQAQVMVGSSMAIRDVDSFWPAALPGQAFYGNRGASGIDGLVSTGLGIAAAVELPTILLLGDLSLYHDMNGLWAIRRHGLRVLLLVLDNNGGGIFHHLPQVDHPDVFEDLFGTPLGLDLEAVANLYHIPFRAASTLPELPPAIAWGLAQEQAAMVAVRFSREGSVAGHRTCWAAVAASLGSTSEQSSE
jgi:2-succinyl-5-enolpyruvyl-6-hydroxy-3-cyclohexene-1-carboxylate synthase